MSQKRRRGINPRPPTPAPAALRPPRPHGQGGWDGPEQRRLSKPRPPVPPELRCSAPAGRTLLLKRPCPPSPPWRLRPQDTRDGNVKRSSGAPTSAGSWARRLTPGWRGGGRGAGDPVPGRSGGRASGYLPALHHMRGHRHLELQVGVVLRPGVVVPHSPVVAVGVPLELLLSPGKSHRSGASPATPPPLASRGSSPWEMLAFTRVPF